ncbi:MAG: hypothetical protein Q7T52_11435, partial [Nocardioides sp.]|nr:hypothetical protein [Nocardioides sp.]
MRSRRTSPEHQEAVSRRLALLSEQLAAAREEAPAVGDEWWGGHTRVAPVRPPLHVVPETWDEPRPPPEPEPRPGPPPPPPSAPAPWDAPTVGGPGPVVVPDPGRHADR